MYRQKRFLGHLLPGLSEYMYMINCWCYCSDCQKKRQLLIIFMVVQCSSYHNIASKFVWSNSILRACFIFLLCALMTSANKSLEKKIFHGVENVIKQLVHTSAVRSSRYEALGKFGEHSRSQSCSWLHLEQLLSIFCALQTSCVLHISMDAHWNMNQLLIVLWGTVG